MIPLDPQTAVEQKVFTTAEAYLLITFPVLPSRTRAFVDSQLLFFSFNVQVMLIEIPACCWLILRTSECTLLDNQ